MDRREFLRALSSVAAGAVISRPSLLTTAAGPAPDPPRYSPAEAWAVALLDASKIQAGDVCYMRWLWVAEPTSLFRAAFKLHLNLLSRYSEMVDVYVVAPNVWRIDLREPQWNPGTWENALNTDPYFHFTATVEEDVTFSTYWPGGFDAKQKKTFEKGKYAVSVKAGQEAIVTAPWVGALKHINDLRETVYSECPMLNAEWFLRNTAAQVNGLNQKDSGIGYYDWHEWKSRKDYFETIDPKSDLLGASELFGKEYLEALENSGISPQNRQIFSGRARGGRFWVTLDTDVQKGRGVALRNLRKPDIDGRKKHDAKGRMLSNTQEWIAFGSNGLPKTLLSDGDGNLQARAPGDTHGLHDRSSLNESPGAPLEANISCWNCHQGKILKDFKGDVRDSNKPEGKDKVVWQLLGTGDKQTDLEFRRLFNSDIYTPLAEDQKKFQRAFTLATVTPDYPFGLTPQKAIVAYADAFYKYGVRGFSIDKAARWVGVKTSEYLSALRNAARPHPKASVLFDTALARYLRVTPVNLSALTFEDCYSLSCELMAKERTVKK